MQHVIGVIGPGGDAPPHLLVAAEQVGRLLAEQGHSIVNGGLGGVLAAVSQGASERGGLVVGILPGNDRREANPYLTVALPTGLGELRNGLIIRASDALICIGGSWGTLSEIALAVRTGVPVAVLHGWDLPAPGPVPAGSAEEAVRLALELAAQRPDR